MQGSPDAKKPCKGILKTSSSFDRHSGAGVSYRKSAKFDELNVLQTYHPPDKDYGHMTIEEPKTPYNYAEVDPEDVDELDAELLVEKLMIASDALKLKSYFAGEHDDDEESSDDNRDETEEEKDRRLAFERRRKAHYNEYEAVRLARKLIEEEDDDDDEDENSDKQSKRNASTSSKEMDVDIQDDTQQQPSQSTSRH